MAPVNRRLLSRPEAEVLNRLVQVRRHHGLSTTEVARRMNVTQASISNFENGHNSPTLAKLLRYAQAVGAEIRIGPTAT